jgi:hypothetical protein
MAGRISPIRAKARDPSVVEARASPGGPILAREAISSIGSGREKIPVPPIVGISPIPLVYYWFRPRNQYINTPVHGLITGVC